MSIFHRVLDRIADWRWTDRKINLPRWTGANCRRGGYAHAGGSEGCWCRIGMK